MVKKKARELAVGDLRNLIERGCKLTVSRQCELLELSRSTYYYEACVASKRDLMLMNSIDEIFTEHSDYGSRRIRIELDKKGIPACRDLVRKLMRFMRVEPIYAKPKLSIRNPDHVVYPYLLRGVSIDRINQVWSSDITYIRMRNGFLYLTAVIDWHSRYVLSWKLSNTLDGDFCLEAVKEALLLGKPEIFNVDQGCQYTCKAFVELILGNGMKLSMDGKGRYLDNILIERLWRSVKHEEVYVKDYLDGLEACRGFSKYFNHYNEDRPHQSLSYNSPADVYFGRPLRYLFSSKPPSSKNETRKLAHFPQLE